MKHFLLFLSIIFLTENLLFAQANNKAQIKGKVVDATTNEALSFASIRVSNSADNKLITGNITNEKGEFSIAAPYGNYYIEVEYMGYKNTKTAKISLTKENPVIDFGNIKIEPSANALKEVVVQAEKSSMEMKLDKRVFNVGKDLANAGGSASDILTNIPSVSVDPDGGVKLRGSDNVRILIDGKPSGLVSFKGGSGLQSLQASMIERVEVITNPSARYEAEGMAGIINIILKKDQKQGFNGSFDVITGQPVNYGGAANINYRHRKVNFFVNYSIAYNIRPNVSSLSQERQSNDTTFFLKQRNNGTLTGFNTNIRGGLDYFFNDKNTITASYLYRRSKARRITNLRYEDYLFTNNNLTGISKRKQDEQETEPNSEYVLSYKKTYARKGQEFNAEIRFLDNWESSDQLFTQDYFTPNETIISSKSLVQNSLNDEFEKQWLFQIDYVQPIGKEGKFETGLRSSFRDMVNDYVVNQKNEQGQFVVVPGLKNYFIYDENINAAYAILGNKTKQFSYQAGLRAEWTDVKTTLRETNEVNPRKYANLFPSLHLTYALPQENSIQVSYSRRVRRPFYNDLSPFATFSDNRNFFGGNPNLNPEFSNVYEIGHIKYFEKGSLGSSVYYRDTDGKIERIRQVNALGFATTRPENLLGEQAYGMEFTSQYNLAKWWKLDFNFNLFHATIDGSNIDKTYKRETNSWFIRQTSRFNLPKGLDLQIRGNYEAKQKTVQGTRLPLYYFDFSASKDVFKGNGTLNFSILDIFNTRKFRSITEGSTFRTEGSSQFRRRQFNLTLNYRIKQSKGAGKGKKLELEG
ncbi:TonB-dependent receptor [Emticicia oligotrophica DSM 17448]|uniref:TonB-dependent receptor n=1 Tax=Emticicia oligotrophica (strain DSM 17448 / CIP 109782 / MTCC 6937 / GPTSA100-15) TaxID=929562 RepID=A0ABM5MXY8_EMTOG|nr:outer membrane beta-barrel family protein [Emticicia oligotrophica]AFK02022.1 TonB-dependent receptor [Emticicia oligotrophica DSM 17448]